MALELDLVVSSVIGCVGAVLAGAAAVYARRSLTTQQVAVDLQRQEARRVAHDAVPHLLLRLTESNGRQIVSVDNIGGVSVRAFLAAGLSDGVYTGTLGPLASMGHSTCTLSLAGPWGRHVGADEWILIVAVARDRDGCWHAQRAGGGPFPVPRRDSDHHQTHGPGFRATEAFEFVRERLSAAQAQVELDECLFREWRRFELTAPVEDADARGNPS